MVYVMLAATAVFLLLFKRKNSQKMKQTYVFSLETGLGCVAYLWLHRHLCRGFRYSIDKVDDV